MTLIMSVDSVLQTANQMIYKTNQFRPMEFWAVDLFVWLVIQSGQMQQ